MSDTFDTINMNNIVSTNEEIDDFLELQYENVRLKSECERLKKLLESKQELLDKLQTTMLLTETSLSDEDDHDFNSNPLSNNDDTCDYRVQDLKFGSYIRSVSISRSVNDDRCIILDIPSNAPMEIVKSKTSKSIYITLSYPENKSLIDFLRDLQSRIRQEFARHHHKDIEATFIPFLKRIKDETESTTKYKFKVYRRFDLKPVSVLHSFSYHAECQGIVWWDGNTNKTNEKFSVYWALFQT